MTLGFPRRHGLIDWSATRRRAAAALDVLGADIDPDVRIQNLSRTEKSLVAIARALAAEAEILVLDEPTASLPADEVARLFSALRPIWVFDNQVKSNPISIATFPLPKDRDYIAVGGHFGPHNIHENRPGSFQSSSLIFATYQNAGVRVYDISDQFRPIEVGACVPPAPKKLVDPRPDRPVVLHSADVFVDRNGICYCTEWSGAGLYIMEYAG